MTSDNPGNLVVIVMGVSGSGKTTVGRVLASSLGWTFVDADDFHSPANIAKMRDSIPLTEADRQSWLDAIIKRVNLEARGQVVLACSALSHATRERFRAELRCRVVFVYLKLDFASLHARLTQRKHHFASAGLLASQFEALEEPKHALVVQAGASPELLCTRIREELARR